LVGNAVIGKPPKVAGGASVPGEPSNANPLEPYAEPEDGFESVQGTIVPSLVGTHFVAMSVESSSFAEVDSTFIGALAEGGAIAFISVFDGESATAEAANNAPPHKIATAKIHSLLMLMGVLL
jgi:hypothetical protein